MKVAIVCYNHFDATISLGKYLKLINKSIEIHFIFLLSQTFLDIEIINLNNRNVRNGFLSKKDIEEFIDKEIFDYLDGINLDIFIFNSWKFADIKNFRLLFELRQAVNNKYDIFHLVGNNRWIILLNCLLYRSTKVHTLHEPFPFYRYTKYKLLRHKWKMGLLIHSDSYIIVPSVISYNRFNSYFHIDQARLGIIPFGPMEIFQEYSKNHISKKNNLILFYGNISKYKGVDILIAAMKGILTSNPDLKLIIAGAGLFDHNTSALNGNFELINRHLSNKEIAELNKMATVIVCPYTSASQSGVVMTSFAFNNPVIATNVGALPEFIENGITGVIVEPGDPDMLRKTIVDLFNNLHAIETMRINISEKYSNSKSGWLEIAKETYELYENKLKSN